MQAKQENSFNLARDTEITSHIVKATLNQIIETDRIVKLSITTMKNGNIFFKTYYYI